MGDEVGAVDLEGMLKQKTRIPHGGEAHVQAVCTVFEGFCDGHSCILAEGLRA